MTEKNLTEDDQQTAKRRRIAEAVRRARKNALMAQTLLAQASGLNERTIRRVEAGEEPVSFETLRAIGAVLDLDVARLAPDVEEKQPSAIWAAVRVVRSIALSYLLIWSVLIAGAAGYISRTPDADIVAFQQDNSREALVSPPGAAELPPKADAIPPKDLPGQHLVARPLSRDEIQGTWLEAAQATRTIIKLAGIVASFIWALYVSILVIGNRDWLIATSPVSEWSEGKWRSLIGRRRRVNG